ncbi:rod shape-determining protein RodA [Cytobacillus purgationiresistens]|uniref:Rod shape-determining protein RodA n=1 Tax=Cytobacillus purgationiresistens TaxID=863449 RepID=A0ABU0AD74_9BACI|nr:rod shape-determining protein RodA [Cytobacillus purgationiresistens]MDQ0268383.1 rod shape-determining protein RodA [Cytobacillus purgationiresistens]
MKQNENNIDYPLLLVLFCLIIISLLAVYSGSGQYYSSDPFYYLKRQAIWYMIGIAVMAAVAYFDYELLERWATPLYIVGVILLLLVHFFGVYRNGAQRWLNIGIFEPQPSEFFKIFILLFLSVILYKKGKKRLSFIESIPITAKVGVFSIIPFYLILVQPDLGSALIIAAIAFTLIAVSGISYKMILLIVAGGTGLVGFLVFLHNQYFDLFIKIIKPHQLERIYGWLDPHGYASSFGYQLTRAMLGIGSGQMSGWGFTQGVQVQSGQIPEAHTDFIFAVIGEEFGFIGASVLITLYFLMIYRIVIIALHSHNLFGFYICTGAIGLISFQAFQNIAMTIGVMPITGITLPFISYGGSGLLTNMITLGLVLSVNLKSKRYMFSNNE